jgi:acetyl esterase/lipase
MILAGGSAGAHLAATAALTVGEARFQPGFEAVDTSISAVVAMYGYYGLTGSDDDIPSSPSRTSTPTPHRSSSSTGRSTHSC